MKTTAQTPRPEANQTVRVEVDTLRGRTSIRIGFTDQRLTAHGGMAAWSHFMTQLGARRRIREALPHDPTSPNAYDPADIALGYVGGILAGADKLSRVAWLRSDLAIAEVLGIEAVPSQSTLSRFFDRFTASANERLQGLYRWTAAGLPSRAQGYTLDLDSWALLHEDGHQEGVAVGYTRKGLKPCLRPLVGVLAEAQLVLRYRLRAGNTACVNGAAEFLKECVASLPSHIRLGLIRGDSGFAADSVQSAVEGLGLNYIFARRMDSRLKGCCRHDDAAWQCTDVPGIEVQEVATSEVGRRLIVIRQRVADRPNAGGRMLLDVPGYRFQALITNLPSSVAPLEVWRRYNGRADIENRIKEIGDQFGVKALCARRFWATEAIHLFAILAYNLCVLLQRRLGQLERCELNTLRWRLFTRAAVWSRAQGKACVRLAVPKGEARQWWLDILEKLTGPPNCNAVGSLQA